MLLSEIDESICIDTDANYQIKVDNRPFIMFKVGFDASSPKAQFDHPNLLACIYRCHEFKHYRHNGTKYWTKKPGVDLYFAVPKNKIELPNQPCGYSYPVVHIDNEEVTLTVSGGTLSSNDRPGWTDFIGNQVSTCINIKKKTLKTIADNAHSISEAKRLGISIQHDNAYPYPNETEEEAQRRAVEEKEREIHEIREMVAKSVVGPMLDKGMKVMLASGYSLAGTQGPFDIIYNRAKKNRNVVVGTLYNTARAYYKHIDWIKTAQENDIEVPALVDMIRV